MKLRKCFINVLLTLVLSVLLASCAQTNRGFFSTDEISSFEDNYRRISGYEQTNGHLNLLGSGRVEMTGMYLLKRSRATDMTELGQIDLFIDFDDSTERPRGSWRNPIISGELSQFSRVTGLLESFPETGVG